MWGLGEPKMIREHITHIRNAVDEQSIPIRVGITLTALLSLPLLGTGVRTLGSALNLGWLTTPLLVVAHVPVVVALIAIWSIGCDVCR
jgi:hypothetical protein